MEKNESFLDWFLRLPTTAGEAKTPVLSRAAASQESEVNVLGRVALLNMLLRRRAPRRRWAPSNDGRAVVTEPEPPRLRPGEEPIEEELTVHSLLWRSRCHGVFTSNYDLLLEHAFSLYRHGSALRYHW